MDTVKVAETTVTDASAAPATIGTDGMSTSTANARGGPSASTGATDESVPMQDDRVHPPSSTSVSAPPPGSWSSSAPQPPPPVSQQTPADEPVQPAQTSTNKPALLSQTPQDKPDLRSQTPEDRGTKAKKEKEKLSSPPAGSGGGKLSSPPAGSGGGKLSSPPAGSGGGDASASSSEDSSSTDTDQESIDGSSDASSSDSDSSGSGSDEGEEDRGEVFTVERILQFRPGQHGGILYLVKWEGYDHSENTWEPETCFDEPYEALVNFWAAQPEPGADQPAAVVHYRKFRAMTHARAKGGPGAEKKEKGGEEQDQDRSKKDKGKGKDKQKKQKEKEKQKEKRRKQKEKQRRKEQEKEAAREKRKRLRRKKRKEKAKADGTVKMETVAAASGSSSGSAVKDARKVARKVKVKSEQPKKAATLPSLEMCLVCSQRSTLLDPLMDCVRCGTAVHASCYGLAQWWDPARNRYKDPSVRGACHLRKYAVDIDAYRRKLQAKLTPAGNIYATPLEVPADVPEDDLRLPTSDLGRQGRRRRFRFICEPCLLGDHPGRVTCALCPCVGNRLYRFLPKPFKGVQERTVPEQVTPWAGANTGNAFARLGRAQSQPMRLLRGSADWADWAMRPTKPAESARQQLPPPVPDKKVLRTIDETTRAQYAGEQQRPRQYVHVACWLFNGGDASCYQADRTPALLNDVLMPGASGRNGDSSGCGVCRLPHRGVVRCSVGALARLIRQVRASRASSESSSDGASASGGGDGGSGGSSIMHPPASPALQAAVAQLLEMKQTQVQLLERGCTRSFHPMCSRLWGAGLCSVVRPDMAAVWAVEVLREHGMATSELLPPKSSAHGGPQAHWVLRVSLCVLHRQQLPVFGALLRLLYLQFLRRNSPFTPQGRLIPAGFAWPPMWRRDGRAVLSAGPSARYLRLSFSAAHRWLPLLGASALRLSALAAQLAGNDGTAGTQSSRHHDTQPSTATNASTATDPSAASWTAFRRHAERMLLHVDPALAEYGSWAGRSPSDHAVLCCHAQCRVSSKYHAETGLSTGNRVSSNDAAESKQAAGAHQGCVWSLPRHALPAAMRLTGAADRRPKEPSAEQRRAQLSFPGAKGLSPRDRVQWARFLSRGFGPQLGEWVTGLMGPQLTDEVQHREFRALARAYAPCVRYTFSAEAESDLLSEQGVTRAATQTQSTETQSRPDSQTQSRQDSGLSVGAGSAAGAGVGGSRPDGGDGGSSTTTTSGSGGSGGASSSPAVERKAQSGGSQDEPGWVLPVNPASWGSSERELPAAGAVLAWAVCGGLRFLTAAVARTLHNYLQHPDPSDTHVESELTDVLAALEVALWQLSRSRGQNAASRLMVLFADADRRCWPLPEPHYMESALHDDDDGDGVPVPDSVIELDDAVARNPGECSSRQGAGSLGGPRTLRQWFGQFTRAHPAVLPASQAFDKTAGTDGTEESSSLPGWVLPASFLGLDELASVLRASCEEVLSRCDGSVKGSFLQVWRMWIGMCAGHKLRCKGGLAVFHNVYPADRKGLGLSNTSGGLLGAVPSPHPLILAAATRSKWFMRSSWSEGAVAAQPWTHKHEDRYVKAFGRASYPTRGPQYREGQATESSAPSTQQHRPMAQSSREPVVRADASGARSSSSSSSHESAVPMQTSKPPKPKSLMQTSKPPKPKSLKGLLKQRKQRVMKALTGGSGGSGGGSGGSGGVKPSAATGKKPTGRMSSAATSSNTSNATAAGSRDGASALSKATLKAAAKPKRGADTGEKPPSVLHGEGTRRKLKSLLRGSRQSSVRVTKEALLSPIPVPEVAGNNGSAVTSMDASSDAGSHADILQHTTAGAGSRGDAGGRALPDGGSAELHVPSEGGVRPSSPSGLSEGQKHVFARPADGLSTDSGGVGGLGVGDIGVGGASGGGIGGAGESKTGSSTARRTHVPKRARFHAGQLDIPEVQTTEDYPDNSLATYYRHVQMVNDAGGEEQLVLLRLPDEDRAFQVEHEPTYSASDVAESGGGAHKSVFSGARRLSGLLSTVNKLSQADPRSLGFDGGESGGGFRKAW